MWEHAWSTARFHLGLSDEEFWRLTPRKLRLLRDRYEEQQARDEHSAGVIAAAIYNVMGRAETTLEPADFFGARWARQIRRRKDKLTHDPQRIAAAFRSLMRVTPKS